MNEFIAYLVKNLVDKPELVKIEAMEVDQEIVLEVSVSPEDVAKVIGRQGRTIQSLRTIAISVGARLGKKIKLEVVN
ncbi:MAG: KH domain-containing protein [Rhabdochlamydiaceae bacterium]